MGPRRARGPGQASRWRSAAVAASRAWRTAETGASRASAIARAMTAGRGARRREGFDVGHSEHERTSRSATFGRSGRVGLLDPAPGAAAYQSAATWVADFVN